ncbi:MAG: CoB--CoM heterodisulfide reductase iron-sulfur subunit A family protein [Methanobacteriota archaeon]|nr:MAG: CoB--CoM heterodisulfide reductase iron-sulfur subunit A family protein [Euryarchaeota archaeon]
MVTKARASKGKGRKKEAAGEKRKAQARKKSPETKAQERPRIGVFVCHCGTNIAGVVDVKEVARYAGEKASDVVYATDSKYMCSEPGQKEIIDAIKEHKLNRIVVAACSPRMHEPTFRRAAQAAGINPYYVDMANIREHCSWVHIQEKEAATEKAKDLVRMSVARARLLEPQEKIKVPVRKSTLVIGGGIAGIQAALDLADMGYKVYLVEKQPTIGGKMAQLDKTFPTMDCAACILTPKMVDASRHENIELITYAEVKNITGYVGNFTVTVTKKPRYVIEDLCTGCMDCAEACPVEVPNEFDQGLGSRKAIYVPFPQAVPLIYTLDEDTCIGCGACKNVCTIEAIDFNQQPQEVTLEVGTIIIATGYQIFDATRKPEYGYGKYENVINGLEFERLINASGPTGGKLLRPSDGKEPRSIAFIQCVGSRDENTNLWCSRVCCMYAIKNARLYKEKHPETEIYIFYIDIRAFGKGYEEFYKIAQEEYGIKFFKGRPSVIYEDPSTARLILNVEDTMLGRKIEVEVDLVVLSVGMEPGQDTETIGKMLGVSRGADGFFLEAHPKLRPVDTLVEGVYLAGTAQGPKDIPDTVAQASGAAARASILMAKGEVEIDPVIAYSEKELCIGCRICERICPASAISMEDRKAVVNEAMCIGCGLCAGGCPTGAMKLRHFKDEQILAQIHAALAED